MSGPQYDPALIVLVQNADQRLLGVKLGALCISKDIPVHDVADFFNVPRPVVLAWFKGEVKVPNRLATKVADIISKLS